MQTAEVRQCSVARTLDVVGEKWSLLAVREMMLGTHRFDEMVRYTGAPRDILTARLRKLEEHGLVERRQYSERPPRFEYHLTPPGTSLLPIVTMLRDWGDEHLAGTEGPPVVFAHSCGADLKPQVTCAACHEPVSAGDLSINS